MIVRLGAQLLRLAFAADARRFRRALAHPEEAQARVKAAVAGTLAGTAYAKARGFDGSLASFDRLPVVDHDAIAPFIDDQMRGGPNAIANEKTLFFEKTSGSSGPAKYIPYTRSLKRTFSHLFRVWAHDLIAHGPGFRTGRFYFSISPSFDLEETAADGTPVGLATDAEYLDGFSRRVLSPFFVADPRCHHERDPERFRDLTALSLLQSEKLEIVSVWNPSFLRVHLDHIQRHGPRLVEALAHTHRRRADALRNLLTDADVQWGDVWPHLKLISCWSAGFAQAPADALRHQFPGVFVQGKGLLATEAPVTVPLAQDRHREAEGQVPLVDGILLEFEDADGNLHPITDVDEGGLYTLVISVPGGFARYRLGDRVRIGPRIEETPRLAFVGRGDATSDLVGEKLSERFVEEALAGLNTGAPFQTLVPNPGPPARYVLLMNETGRDVDALASALEVKLCRAFHYRHARKLGQLGPAEVLVTPDAEQRVVAAWMAAERKWGDLKYRALTVSPRPDLSPCVSAVSEEAQRASKG